MAFLDEFTYSDNSIDGKSKKKAYTLTESGLLNSMEPGTVKMSSADTRLHFWWAIRFCGTDTDEEYLERWNVVLSCRISDTESEDD